MYINYLKFNYQCRLIYLSFNIKDFIYSTYYIHNVSRAI